MKKYGRPRSVVTDGLRAYSSAMNEIGNADRQEVGRRLNNRAENSRQPFRRRERAMQRFRSMKTLQAHGVRRLLGGRSGCARTTVITARRTRTPPIAASIAPGMKTTCRRRKPLDATMIGRQGVFQIRGRPKRTALENLKAAGAQQAHN